MKRTKIFLLLIAMIFPIAITVGCGGDSGGGDSGGGGGGGGSATGVWDSSTWDNATWGP